MKIPFIAVILQGIPETIAVTLLAFIVARINLEWKKIILIGLIIPFTSYFLRMLPITFGIHTVLIIGLLFVLLLVIGKGNLNASLIASLVSILALIISETICLSILMPLFGITSEQFFSDTFIRIIITLPQVFLLFILAFILYRFRTKNSYK